MKIQNVLLVALAAALAAPSSSTVSAGAAQTDPLDRPAAKGSSVSSIAGGARSAVSSALGQDQEQLTQGVTTRVRTTLSPY